MKNRQTVHRRKRAQSEPGPARKEQVGPSFSSPSVEAILHLQRTVGNRVTRAVIAGRIPNRASPTIQRQEESGSFLGEAWDKVTEVAAEAYDWLTSGDVDDVNKPAPAPKGKKSQPVVPLVPPSGPVLITDGQALIRRDPPDLTSKGKDKVIPQGTWVFVEEAVQKGAKQYVKAKPANLEAAPADVARAPGPETDPETPEGWTAASNADGLVMEPKGDEPANGPTDEPKDKPAKPESLDDELKRIDEMKITLERGEGDAELIDQMVAENRFSEEERAKLDKVGAKEDATKAPKVADFEKELEALTKAQVELQRIQNNTSLAKEEQQAQVEAQKEVVAGHLEKLNKMKKVLLGRLPTKRGKDKKAKKGLEGEMKLQILLAQHGISLDQWFADMYPNATFLGVKIKGQSTFLKKKLGGVHKELYDRLKRAEQFLMDETGLDAKKTGRKLGVSYVGGVRAAHKGDTISLHKLGLAVDINAGSSNPWIRDSSKGPLRRATQLINADPFDVGMKIGAGGVKKRVGHAEKMFTKLTDVGKALEIYFKFRTETEVTHGGRVFSLERLAGAYGAATGERLTVTEWQAQIEKDYATLKAGNYGKKRDPAKASSTMNLDKRLVMALVKAGLTWGAFFHGGQGKDIMHFDWRGGTIIEDIRQDM